MFATLQLFPACFRIRKGRLGYSVTPLYVDVQYNKCGIPGHCFARHFQVPVDMPARNLQ